MKSFHGPAFVIHDETEDAGTFSCSILNYQGLPFCPIFNIHSYCLNFPGFLPKKAVIFLLCLVEIAQSGGNVLYTGADSPDPSPLGRGIGQFKRISVFFPFVDFNI
jgi:hypothetical protein